MEHEEEVWNVVQGKVCLAVRSTMDIFDRFTAKASDPVIEPMLQSIPDPFDSYGPPQAEDQIFSILPPLSIMNAPSPSPSPLTVTPERESTTSLPSGSKSWIPTNGGGFFSESTSEWADVPSPSSTPPRSVSPPIVNRKHSTPSSAPTPHPRKSESKLRSVLAAIDEGRPQQASENNSVPDPAPMASVNDDPPDPNSSWTSFTYGQSPYMNVNESEPTPRNSALFASQSRLEPPDPVVECNRTPQPDEVVHIPLAAV